MNVNKKITVVWCIFAVVVIAMLFYAAKQYKGSTRNVNIDELLLNPHELAFRKNGKEVPPQITALIKRLNENGEDLDALLALSTYQIAIGDTDLAEANIFKASIIAEDTATLMVASVLYGRLGIAKKAYAALGKALVTEPDNAELHYRAGIIAFHNLSDTGLAIQHWKRFIELKPGTMEAEEMNKTIDYLMSKSKS